LTSQGPVVATSWLLATDQSREVVNHIPDGSTTRIVPLQVGADQGVVYAVNNVGDQPITVISARDDPELYRVSLSSKSVDGSNAGNFHTSSFEKTVTILPGQAHLIKVVASRPLQCQAYPATSHVDIGPVTLTVSISGGPEQEVQVQPADNMELGVSENLGGCES
jgi:hypothetical protein